MPKQLDPFNSLAIMHQRCTH